MNDSKTCANCGQEKDWKRFRIRRGDGTFADSDTCSVCRGDLYRAKTRRAKQLTKQAVLNRTIAQTKNELGAAHYYPKIESAIRSYCNKQTAMDRKYLRDLETKPKVDRPCEVARRTIAIERAKGWIGFYDEIAEHSIKLLRATGTRPSFRSMEESPDLQNYHGIYNTKRARRLRGEF